MPAKFVVVGGGIAGVTCAETLSDLSPEDDVLLVTASKLIKAVTNYQKVSQALESFDVEERHMSMMETDCPNVKVIQKAVASLDPEKHVLKMSDGTDINYCQLCICTGGRPKVIAPGNPYVIGIRDTESVKILFKEFGHVWWVDSSVRFITDNLEGPLDYLRNTSSLFFTYGNILSVAKHTRLTTFNYFKEHPCPYGEFGEIEAGNVAFDNSRVSRAIVLKWVSCALTEDCIQPPGHSGGCVTDTSIVGSCHRFDQSALSIILRRLYHEQNDYPLVIRPFRIIKVMRRQAVKYFKTLKET